MYKGGIVISNSLYRYIIKRVTIFQVYWNILLIKSGNRVGYLENRFKNYPGTRVFKVSDIRYLKLTQKIGYPVPGSVLKTE